MTREQLGLAGLRRSAIDRRLASGRLRLLHRGVYLALPFPLPHTREMAAVLASGAGVVLSHESVAALVGLRPAVEGDVDVLVEGNRGHRPGIRAHRVERLAADERTVWDGIPITTPTRTLLDLATVLDARALEAAVARAEREGFTTPEALWALSRAMRARRVWPRSGQFCKSRAARL